MSMFCLQVSNSPYKGIIVGLIPTACGEIVGDVTQNTKGLIISQ